MGARVRGCTGGCVGRAGNSIRFQIIKRTLNCVMYFHTPHSSFYIIQFRQIQARGGYSGTRLTRVVLYLKGSGMLPRAW